MTYSRIPNKRKIKKHSTDDIFNLRKLLFLFTALGFIGIISWVFLVLPIAQIRDLEIIGVHRIKSDDVLKVVKTELAGSYWKQINKAQFVLVRTNKIEEKIYSEFGAVRKVVVRKIFPNKLQIKIKEWDRVYLWCVSKEDCRLLEITDSGAVVGRVIQSGEMLLDDNSVTKIIDTSNRDIDFGTIVYNLAQFEFVQNLANGLNNIGIRLIENSLGNDGFENIAFTTPSRVSGYLRVTTAENWDILVSVNQPLSTTINTLRAILEKVITPEGEYNIQYIDLRFNSKVIYKLKNL